MTNSTNKMRQSGELLALLGSGAVMAPVGGSMGAIASGGLPLSMLINLSQGEPVLEQSNPALANAMKIAAVLGTLGAGAGYARGRNFNKEDRHFTKNKLLGIGEEGATVYGNSHGGGLWDSLRGGIIGSAAGGTIGGGLAFAEALKDYSVQ